jgi:hypothetical protein
MQETDKEKLREFEQKMHDEGADGFADGPRPWETWDESGAQAPGTGRHVWEGKARRIYKTAPVKRSAGDRVISGLATIAMATMVVGIAGVFLTEEKPESLAWTAITPTPIPLPGQLEAASRVELPARVTRPAPVIAEIESLPPSAAGAGSATRGVDSAPTETSANDGPALAETEPAGDSAAVDAPPAVSASADDPAWDPAASETDIEIVTAPSTLLLTSPTDSSQDSSGEVSGMEMDPALAMEIATAPAVDSKMDVEPAAAATVPSKDSGTKSLVTTGPDSKRQFAAVPARDLIIRGPAAPAVADSPIPEAGITTTGVASTTEVNTTADAVATASKPSEPFLSLTDAKTIQAAGSEVRTATAVEAFENLPPPAAGTTVPAAEATSPETPGKAVEPAVGSPDDGEETMAAGNDSAASENTVVALADPVPVTSEPSPAEDAAAPSGGWVVNLASYNHEAMARKMLNEFQAKGVKGEIENITINDRQMYRIRVTGFENSRAARASISSLEETLGLKGAWISRR